MIADLDTLLTALYVELTDRIIPGRGFIRSGPGQRPEVTDAELVCIAVAQVLLRFDDERHWLRAAARQVGHLFPRLLGQSEYNTRLKAAAPLMEAALRWLADATPATGELVRLMDATPVPCGQSVVTARRSDLYGYAGYGYCPSHSRWYWGAKLLLTCTCDGTVTGFGLANPEFFGEREQARQRRCQRGGYHANVSLPLTTKRLIIRPFTPADFEAIHAVWSDPAVMAPIPSQAYDREQSWTRLRKTFSHQARHGFSKWAVAEKATGTVIGECGVHYLEDGPDVELGYKLARAYWGQGLAPEAAQACLDWALAERPERVVAIVDPANIRSARILGKIGMVRDGTFSGSGHTWDFYVAISCQVTGTELQPHGRLPGTQFARLVAVDQVGYLAHRLSSRFPRLEGSASLEVI